MRHKVFFECAAECVGTFILVFFGCGSVVVSMMTGAELGSIGVAAVWGGAVSLAIYLMQAHSSAHFNPAITISMALFRSESFPARRVIPYIGAQLAGAVIGGAVLYALFHGTIFSFELAHQIVRGDLGSQLSAMVFGEYFANPALYGTGPEGTTQVTLRNACAAELLGTACLSFAVFALTEKRNPLSHKFHVVPLLIGCAIAVIILIVSPLTQAGLNPARDFGPRLISYFAGWKAIAIPGPRGGFLSVYVVSPIIGAIIGGGLYRLLYKNGLSVHSDAERGTISESEK